VTGAGCHSVSGIARLPQPTAAAPLRKGGRNSVQRCGSTAGYREQGGARAAGDRGGLPGVGPASEMRRWPGAEGRRRDRGAGLYLSGLGSDGKSDEMGE